MYFLYGETASGSLADGVHMESIAERSRAHDWEIGLHWHEDFLQILHIESGGGRWRIGALEGELAPPCLVIVSRLVPHGFRFDTSTIGVVLTMHHARFDQVFGTDPDLGARLQGAGHFPLDGHEARDAIADAMQALRREFAATAPWRQRALDARLTALGVAVARHLALADPADLAAHRPTRHIGRFKSLLDVHFRAHWPVVAYADALGITTTQLNRICRAQLGKSALMVINDRVMVEAERDLAYTSLPVKAVAYMLGFQDVAYFTRFFRRHKACSPSEFRRRAGALFKTLESAPPQPSPAAATHAPVPQ